MNYQAQAGDQLRTTLTLLLLAAQRVGKEQYEYEVYEVLHHLIDLAGWGDERKADLYAMLVERIRADMTMLEIERHVEDCLRKNQREFIRRG